MLGCWHTACVPVLIGPLSGFPARPIARRIFGALVTHTKVLLLLAQELPQCPIKPLGWLTPEPLHERVRLETPHGPVVGDLFQPATPARAKRPRPAIVLAFGMALHTRDRPVLLGLARTLARLGYVVLWPRLEALEGDAPLPEEPGTFVAAVEYLSALESVNRERVSLFGFSVGASIALVAACAARGAGRVRAVLFFGGYFDLSEYLVSAASHTMVVGHNVVAWHTTEEVRRRFEPILEAKQMSSLVGLFDVQDRAAAEALLERASPAEVAALRRLSPAQHVAGLWARVFILHDRGDAFVPYVESLKLRDALPDAHVGAFLLTDLFAHAQPKTGLSWPIVRDVMRLYQFVHAALAYY